METRPSEIKYRNEEDEVPEKGWLRKRRLRGNPEVDYEERTSINY